MMEESNGKQPARENSSVSAGKPLFFRHAFTCLVVFVSAALMAVNIKTFIAAGGLYPGGVSGLTLLLQRMAESLFGVKLSFSVINFLLNAFPVWVGFRYLGRRFTLYSCLCIVVTGFMADLLPEYAITYDLTLISVFGGIIQGVAISICLMVNTTTGGTDFIAIYYSQRRQVDAWNAVLAFNVGQLIVAGCFFGWDKALYSIIFQYVSTQVIKMLYRRYQKKTLLIVTNKAQSICRLISEQTGHGATVLTGTGAYGNEKRELVYSVIDDDVSAKVMNGIRNVDPGAFINAFQTDRLAGQFYQRPLL